MPAPQIPNFSGDVPARTQSPSVFATNADAFLNFLATLGTNYNNLSAYLDALAGEADADRIAAGLSAAAAAASATEADGFASAAAANSSFAGVWSSLTGALNTPATVFHNGAIWQLLNDLADVTTSEPSVSADWLFVSGSRWNMIEGTDDLNPNSQYFITATGLIDAFLTQPSFTAGQFLVVSNNISSTRTVRLLNPSNTIVGNVATLSAGDDLVIPAGATIHLVATSPTTLRFV